MIRSAKNERTGKYKKQRERTERNKANRVARMTKRFPRYRAPGWSFSKFLGRFNRDV